MQAPSLGGVTVPRGDGKTTIRVRRGSSLTDFADKINATDLPPHWPTCLGCGPDNEGGFHLQVRREGDAMFVALADRQEAGSTRTVTVYYGGKPRPAPMAPWDGGFIWTRDDAGDPWVATAVQGLGASAWWPNKDLQGDEPDGEQEAGNASITSTTRIIVASTPPPK